MSTYLKESEMILNPDGSIYHLALLPGEIATNIITVGDPDRVDMIAGYLDNIRVTKQNREFKTVTGSIGDKELTIIATGIGTDNIDIVFNELDALVNIDFVTRMIKPEFTQLSFFRIGTSGSINPEILIDSFVASQHAIGLDALGHYYSRHDKADHINYASIRELADRPHYIASADSDLVALFGDEFVKGVTITAPGFYAPQGRTLRVPSTLSNNINELYLRKIKGVKITNLEMETAGIYLLCEHLGHRGISLNAILANRINGNFSNKASETIRTLVEKTLAIIKDL